MKLAILILYFAVLIGIGLYCRKHTTDVNGFVLGGRSVGPWLTAFCLWNLIFFCRCLCRLCRTIWLEIWYCSDLGRYWKCADRLAVSMGCPRSTHPNNDTALRLGNNATVFWRTF